MASRPVPTRRRTPVLGVAVAGLCRLTLAAVSDVPLPDAAEFIEKARTRAVEQFDETSVLAGYVYRLKQTDEDLGRGGTVKKAQTTDAEVYHFEHGRFRKVLARNGVTLSEKDARRQETELSKHVSGEKVQKQTAPPWMPSRGSDEDRLEMMRDIGGAFDFELLRREDLRGRPTIVVRFMPRKRAEFDSRMGKILLPHVEGLAWVDETDLGLSRVEVRVARNVNVGIFGLMARIHKGTAYVRDWLRADGGDWLPATTTVQFKARTLLVRGTHRRMREEYSDYRKLSNSPEHGALQRF